MNALRSFALGSLILGTTLVSAAQAAEGWARSGSSLKAGPGTSWPTITRVSAGEPLDVHGCLRDWSWCDVSTDDERGWLPGRRIALDRDGRRVALPGVAAVIGLGIVGFTRDAYWRDHYRDRPFYGRPDRNGRDRRHDIAEPQRPAPARAETPRPGERTETAPSKAEHAQPAPARSAPASSQPHRPVCPPGGNGCR